MNLVSWLQRATLAYDDYFHDDTSVPDCEDICVTLIAAAGTPLPIRMWRGSAVGSSERARGLHYWLDVDGERFDPKAYLLNERYSEGSYCGYKIAKRDEPAFAADYETDSELLHEAQKLYGFDDLEAVVYFIRDRVGSVSSMRSAR